MAEAVERNETKKREVESSTHLSIGKSGDNMHTFERNVSLSSAAFDKIRAIIAEDVNQKLEDAEKEADALMAELVAAIEKQSRQGARKAEKTTAKK